MTRHSLLVVDDNELNRDVLSRRLAKHGYEVAVAADGEHALDLIARRVYELVLLDVEMPGLSGLDVLTRLRTTHSRTALPIIMVTARSRGSDIVEALQLGANDYVTKPIDFAVALARIETHLSLKLATEGLRESEERYALAVDGSSDGIWDWNLATSVVHWSARWKAMLGYSAAEIGTGPDEWFGRIHPDDVAVVRAALDEHLATVGGHFESEHRLQHRDQTYRWFRCRGAAIRNANGIAMRMAGALTDVTDSKVADALTGLPNRVLLTELLAQAIRRGERHPGYRWALLALGLDRFAAVNDSLGLLTADWLVVAVAHRLQDSIRAIEKTTATRPGWTIARLGNDDFAVLLDDLQHEDEAKQVAEGLQLAMHQAFDVEGHTVFVSAAVGVAIGSPEHAGPDAILHDASIALHKAKASGPNSCEVFAPAMRADAVTRLQSETSLRHAMETGELVVYYQPIVSVRTGALLSFEALARWRHPSRGFVSAAEFIPVAEGSGLILGIERLVLGESCRQLVEWQQRFGAAAPHTVAVNVSAGHFAHREFVNDVEAILTVTGLGATGLTLEITESAFIADAAAAQQTLDRLRNLGIKASIDDFGTGYSSLSYLHRLTVDTVKLDRSFVSRIGVEPSGAELVRGIIGLAHTLGMKVVGEGVETATELRALEDFNCDAVQGFLIGRPLDTSSAERFIAEQPWIAAQAGVRLVS